MNKRRTHSDEITQLHEAKALLKKREEQMAEELALAAELQKSLLPRELPMDAPLEIVQRYIPYLKVGGDFFDFIKLDANSWGIIIIDVSGHGVGPAFLTAMFKSIFHHVARKNLDPAATMTSLNREFCSLIHTEHYLTAFYLIIDTDTLFCEYCNAGHPRQLLIREDGTVQELSSGGFFLGMFEGTEYSKMAMHIEPKDTICLFTDGITETTTADGSQFGRQRLADILISTRRESLETAANSIIHELLQFMPGSFFEDDITLLLLRPAAEL